MSGTNSETIIKNISWGDFISEIVVNRIWKFLCQPIAVFYLLIIVGAVGSSGVWLPLILADKTDTCFNYDETLSVGLATYCIAILSATIADQVLLKEEKNRTVRFFSFSIFALTIVIAYVTLSQKDINLGYWTAGLSYLIWIITYAKDPAKQDQASNSSENPVGGSVTTELQGSTGDFKVK